MTKKKLIFSSEEVEELLGKEYHNLCDLVSDKTGIINAILERDELEQYGFYMYQCLSTNTQILYNLSRNVTSGGLGVNKSKKIALISCLAEAIERYCMTYTPKDELLFEYWKNIDSRYRFDSYYTYSDKQYKKLKGKYYNPLKKKIYWTKIYSANNSKKYKYWPASIIYLPFNYSNPIAETSSTGMAAGFTLQECIENGLCELLERDALMINFLQRLNPPEIDINSINDRNEDLIKLVRKKYNVKIYKLYTDINISIYFSLIWTGKGKKTHFGIGASACFESESAIEKSLKECLFTYFYSGNAMDLRKTKPEEITTLYEHYLYYQKDKFSSLLFDSEMIQYENVTTSYKQVIKELKKNGIEVYYKELTTSDVIDTNFKVVKVIAPGLVDLNKSHLLPRLGADRLWDVPKKLKLQYNTEISKMPHPFP